MDIQDKLNAKYENVPIYTSGFYADPENTLQNQSKLMTALKAFIKNQDAGSPFALQIMTTNSELTIAPLGLLDLQELRDYTAKKRKEEGTIASDETLALPLVVQFEPHTENAKVQREIVTTTDDLFKNFNQTFPKIWDQVNLFLEANQKLLDDVENDLIIDSQKIQPKFAEQIQKLSLAERKKTVGFELPDSDVEQFSRYMSDNQEIKAIASSAASFAQNEIVADQLFAQAMNDRVLRNTFFWDLDNTFYEVFYYYLIKYSKSNGKLEKHLYHIKDSLISMMRNDAMQKANKQTQNPKAKVDFNNYFTDIFMPISEHLTAEIAKFNV
ncbi:hypothetical protein [Loigolactobacillus iwatensis]|uniref:hypothetical protein n=1 Tax=Loigolactobacillus iwatensis TaxID=1267156 RepID=UPI000F7F9ACA|nr:hypothetical protein [Loigolactobacillus iwatensis]